MYRGQGKVEGEEMSLLIEIIERAQRSVLIVIEAACDFLLFPWCIVISFQLEVTNARKRIKYDQRRG